MAKYIVSMAVDGRIDVEVEADNPQEAFKAADYEFMRADLRNMDVVKWKPVHATDEKGDIVAEY